MRTRTWNAASDGGWLAALCVLLSACSSPLAGQGGPGARAPDASDGSGLGDGGLGDGGLDDSDGGSGLGVLDGAGDGKGSGDGLGVGACSCKGVTCGVPKGCPLGVEASCGGCEPGDLCADNKCEADPKCACKPGVCGDIPGCGVGCGGCPPQQVCADNFCIPDCKCAGIECGAPPGCSKSCGACDSGQTCDGNECVFDPKCECKPGMCGLVPGCAAPCGGCGDGEVCSNNACKSGLDCACQGLACGFKSQNCSLSCGGCTAGKACLDNTCGAPPVGKKPYGFGCGPSEDCLPPPVGSSVFAQKSYAACLDLQCATGLCLEGVCTLNCTLAKDVKTNATGAAGPDGIEDEGAVSGCGGAGPGPSGKVFRCVEQATPAQLAQGQSEAACLPGTKFALCKRNADCQFGEVCRLYTVLGQLAGRCGPKVHNTNGTAGPKGSMTCNDNPQLGNIAVCENGFCSAQGCVDLCAEAADCPTAPGSCKAGNCLVNGAKCKSDADCPIWQCKAGVQVEPSQPTLFSVCQPQ